MAPKDRSAAPPLTLLDDLQREVYRFDFFEAVRRLECACPDQPRIGRAARPAEEPVRLGQDPALIFAPSTLSSFTPAHSSSGRPRLAGHFFGLFGPNGPLPLHLTEYAQDRIRQDHDPTFARFLDVFHHRMLCLFYRAWSLSRPPVSFDRPDDDWFARYLASLFGYGLPTLQDRDAFPDRARLYYAGLFAVQTRHPDGLEAMLGDYFRLTVRLREFVGEWLALPAESRCRLGATPDTGSLGQTALAGSHMWSAHHRFGILLGALSYADYQRFLPGQPSLARLTSVVRSYVGAALSWELTLILRKDEVPPLRLDGQGRLGWTTWLPAARVARDPGDLVFEPLACS